MLQRVLIRYVLEPLAHITARFSQKAKDICFVLSCLGVFLLFFARGSGILQCRYLYIYCFGCLFLGLMILCSLKPGLKPVKFRGFLTVCWFAIGLFICTSGILYNIDNLPEAALLLVAYPVVFIVWNNIDSRKVFKLLIRSAELSFVIYLVICLLFYPMDSVRYQGLFTNLNGAAEYLALSSTCLLADCLTDQKLSAKLIVRMILLGISVSLLCYTSSRTGLMGFLTAAIIACGVYIIANRKTLKWSLLRNLSVLCLTIILCFNASIYLFQFNKFVSYSFGDMLEIFHFGSHVPDPSAPQTTDPTAPTPGEIIRPGDSLSQTSDRFHIGNLSLHQITSGRSAIWAGYLKQLNLLGHPDMGTVVFTYDGSERVYHTAHNTILQISYESGIFAGIAYLLFNLTAGVYSVFYAFRHKGDPYAMLPTMVTAAYAVHSLLASASASFYYIITFYYYLVQFPLMVKPEKQQ